MIIVQNLHKKFGERVIIRDFSYHFPKNAKIGMVGPNGAGKTTFLNMLLGLEEIDSGEIIIPSNCVVGHLPQIPNENPKNTILEECIFGHVKLSFLQEKLTAALDDMSQNYTEESYEKYEAIEKEFSDAGGYAIESDAKGILCGLGFETSQFEMDPKNLSGGWRMRLELARLLLNNPNFLILDEPTNHLDLPSLIWLEQSLKFFNGTLLFVSHDKDFLNNISDHILHISYGGLAIYRGNFDNFLEEKEQKIESIQKQKDAIKKKQDHLQEFVNKFKSKASKAKQAQSKIKMIDRLRAIEERLESIPDDPNKKSNFQINVETQSGKVVLDIKDLTIGYSPDNIINKNINMHIVRGSKLAIIGANGIGKSTLLKTIVGEVPHISGTIHVGHNVSIGYYSQEEIEKLDPSLDPLENVLMLTGGKLNFKEARAALGALLIGQGDVKKQVRVLSGGEKSKVAMAALLAMRHNFLILDEPTNHLDMSSVEALADALSRYDGTVMTVSHNRSFIDAFASSIHTLEGLL